MRQQAALFITGVDEDSVRRVFNHWAVKTGHERTVLDISNFNKIAGPMKAGYTEEDMLLSVDGIMLDAWYVANDKLGLHIVFSSEKMPGFIKKGVQHRAKEAAIARKQEEAERKQKEEASRPKLQITPERVAQLSQFRKVG